MPTILAVYRWKCVLGTEEYTLPPHCLYRYHVKHTTPYPHIQLSSWRWTPSFETCRRYHKLLVLIRCIFGLYCIAT